LGQLWRMPLDADLNIDATKTTQGRKKKAESKGPCLCLLVRK
jgi:hypothetical protein